MKFLFTRFLILIAYWCGVDALFFWLNRRAKRIVVFHNVLRDDLFKDGPRKTTAISLREFQRTINECLKLMPVSVDLEDTRTLTITFDDGYRNQYTTAFRLLKNLSVPAIIFIASEIGDGLPIDKAILWKALVPKECVPGGDVDRFWTEQFWPKFLSDGESRGERTVQWLNGIYPLERVFSMLPREYREERLSSISDEQLKEMHESGWIIGWHTRSHYPLSGLSSQDVVSELTPIESCKGMVMAYPYGSEKMVGTSAPMIAKQQGFPYALSYTNSSKMNTSRYFFPRLPYLGSDRYEIAASLSGFRHFMSCRKLLPRVAL